MKRLVFIVLLIGFERVNAQTWVTIPDANFASYLRGLIPTAMSGNQMNTSSILVTTTTQKITASSYSITSLSGVQYFTSLTYLGCNDNQLTSLPALPNTLTFLDCSSNNLTSLPVLPNSLTVLNCNTNSLTTLPTLPSRLDTLICSTNALTTLPNLPNSLTDLVCDYNSLTNLPTLPDSLQYLYCANNNISCFPTFPNTIVYLLIDPNPYNCLPNHLLPPAMAISDCETPLCAAGNSNSCAVAGIQQVAGINNQVTVYPNPAKESLTLTLSQGEGTVNISMYDMLGKLVKQHTYSPPSEGKGEALDVSSLSEGVYNLSISTPDGVANKRVVIER